MNRVIYNVFTTRDLVSKLLRVLRSEVYIHTEEIPKDKDLASLLGIHPVEFSRCIRGVNTMSLPVFLTLCQEIYFMNPERLKRVLI